MTSADAENPSATPPLGFITVVSGLPRSGTSMVMRMLQEGGLPVQTDRVRSADEDNPEGYFELEAVKRIERDASWIGDCVGRAVKVVSFLLERLPCNYEYRVLFLRRRMEEVLASQREMLRRRGESAAECDAKLRTLFETHVLQTLDWIRSQRNFQCLEINYNAILADPAAESDRICDFLGLDLDRRKMAACVNPRLYRQRSESPGEGE
jgi:hypothetical protein